MWGASTGREGGARGAARWDGGPWVQQPALLMAARLPGKKTVHQPAVAASRGLALVPASFRVSWVLPRAPPAVPCSRDHEDIAAWSRGSKGDMWGASTGREGGARGAARWDGGPWVQQPALLMAARLPGKKTVHQPAVAASRGLALVPASFRVSWVLPRAPPAVPCSRDHEDIAAWSRGSKGEGSLGEGESTPAVREELLAGPVHPAGKCWPTLLWLTKHSCPHMCVLPVACPRFYYCCWCRTHFLPGGLRKEPLHSVPLHLVVL